MNLGLMLLIDKQFLKTPFYGVQQMTWHLQNEGHAVNVKRIRRVMRLMRLMPIFQKPDLFGEDGPVVLEGEQVVGAFGADGLGDVALASGRERAREYQALQEQRDRLPTRLDQLPCVSDCQARDHPPLAWG